MHYTSGILAKGLFVYFNIHAAYTAVLPVEGKKHICLCLKDGDPYLLNSQRDNVDRSRVAICLVALGN